MNSIVYIGMDVHTTHYTLCAFTFSTKEPFARTTINPDIKELEQYLKNLKMKLGGDIEFVCGYEAGCLGYSLYHELTSRGYKCIILAPTKIPSTRKEIKTDKRDALKIAKALTFGTYSSVHVPTDQDNAVKEYIRMRDDAKKMLKQTKQQINALCIRHGKIYDGNTKWTAKHLRWLDSLEFNHVIVQEALEEYMITYYQFKDKVDRLDKRIEEFSRLEEYAEKVNKLICFKGIRIHTAMSLVVETSDFQRFPTAQQYAHFLGLTPGERSSSESRNQLPITKAGNSHLRRLLVEAGNCYSNTRVGRKSPELIRRQQGNSPEVIAYADKANDRLRRKYVRISTRSKANIAKTAVARELACFVWGMMNDRIG